MIQILAEVKAPLQVWFLPIYSPHLSPIEQVWRHCQRNVIENVFFKTMRRLLTAMTTFLAKLAAKLVSLQSIISA